MRVLVGLVAFVLAVVGVGVVVDAQTATKQCTLRWGSATLVNLGRETEAECRAGIVSVSPTAPPSPTLSATPTAPPTATPPSTGTPAPFPSATATPAPSVYTKVPCFDAFNVSNRVYEWLEIGPCPDRIAVFVYASTNLTFRHVIIHSAQAGIYALESSGIVVENSLIEDPIGPWSTTFHASCIQYDKVRGGRITGVVCKAGLGEPGDLINLYMTSDTTVEWSDVSGGTHQAGCGIILDGVGSANVRNTIRNNNVSHMVNCAIGVASGTDHVVSGNHATDRDDNATNAYIYVWLPPWYTGPCGNISITDNIAPVPNPFWDAGNCRPITISGNSW